MKLLIEKTKTMFIRLWNELLIFLEYFIKAPFIEIGGLVRGFIKYIDKSHSNGSVTIFYIMIIFTMIQIKTGVDRYIMIFLFFITFVTFIWAMISLPHWKTYYKKKYF